MTGGSAAVEPAAGRFAPGSHVRVRRAWGYMHHGIYVNDDRVIQFGGRIKDKPNATIGAVPLGEFEDGGVAEVVARSRRHFLLPPLPDPQPGDKVIEQAEWLLVNYSPGRYRLIGNNCENIANWCTAGWYAESHQVQTGFSTIALAQAVVLLVAAYRQRTSPVMSKWMIAAGLLSVVGVAAGVTRNRHSKKFWQDFGLKWQAFEQGRKRDSSPDVENK